MIVTIWILAVLVALCLMTIARLAAMNTFLSERVAELRAELAENKAVETMASDERGTATVEFSPAALEKLGAAIARHLMTPGRN